MRLPLRRLDGQGPRARGVQSGGRPAGRRCNRTDRRPATSHQLELDIFARNKPETAVSRRGP